MRYKPGKTGFGGLLNNLTLMTTKQKYSLIFIIIGSILCISEHTYYLGIFFLNRAFRLRFDPTEQI